MWHKDHDCCVKCFTISIAHNGLGMCRRCYAKSRKIKLSKDIDNPEFGYKNKKIKNKKKYIKDLNLKDTTINSGEELKVYKDLLHIYNPEFSIYELSKMYKKRMYTAHPNNENGSEELTIKVKEAYNKLKEYLKSKNIYKDFRTQTLDELKDEMRRNGRGYAGRGNGNRRSLVTYKN